MMVNLKQQAIELIKNLCDENILTESNFDNLENQTFDDIILTLRNMLQKTYPETKLKRTMKSIHYANNFSDKKLKQTAFLLDEIEQYLSINRILDHNKSVAYFNKRITAENFIITPTALVSVMMESLLIRKHKNNCNLTNTPTTNYGDEKSTTDEKILFENINELHITEKGEFIESKET